MARVVSPHRPGDRRSRIPHPRAPEPFSPAAGLHSSSGSSTAPADLQVLDRPLPNLPTTGRSGQAHPPPNPARRMTRPNKALLATSRGKSEGVVRGFSVRCDGQNYLHLMGFLVERSVHADVAGVAAGVAVGRVVAGRGEGTPGGSGGVGCVVGRSGVVVAVGGALAVGVPGDGPVGVDGGAADDSAGDVRAVDGAQAALPVGVSDACRGGVGLDSSAQVLPDLAHASGCRTSRRSASSRGGSVRRRCRR